MSPRPDSDLPSTPLPFASDKGLWWGLGAGFALMALLAVAVHRLVTEAPQGKGDGKATLKGLAPLNGTAPLMSRPQLLENQQAMPELFEFDANNPPPNPTNAGGPLGTPSSPSTLGTGALGQ
jgi:hypothetical protein